MRIRHGLKNGEQRESIKGHKVKRSDAAAVYALIETLNKDGGKHEKKNN